MQRTHTAEYSERLCTPCLVKSVGIARSNRKHFYSSHFPPGRSSPFTSFVLDHCTEALDMHKSASRRDSLEDESGDQGMMMIVETMCGPYFAIYPRIHSSRGFRRLGDNNCQCQNEISWNVAWMAWNDKIDHPTLLAENDCTGQR